MTELFDHGYLSNFRIRLKEITGRGEGGGDDGGRFSSIYKANKFSQMSFIHLDRLGDLGDIFETTRATRRVGGSGACYPPRAITIDLK